MELSKNMFLKRYLWPDYAGKYGEALRDEKQMAEMLKAIIEWRFEDKEAEKRLVQVFKDIMFDYIRALWHEEVAWEFQRTYLNIFD